MKTITTRQLQSQTNPGNGWYMIEAAGNHSGRTVGGDDIVMVIDDEAVRAMVEAGVPHDGLIVDKDHLSHDMDKTTEALGWVRELAALQDGGRLHLAANIEWTPIGLPLIRGKVYKHYSTEYDLGDCADDLGGNNYRPTKLTGLALTNRPNNATGQRAITNRCGGQPKTHNNTDKTMPIIDDIKTRLGLALEATDEDVLSALEAVLNSADSAAEAEAETLLNSEGLEGLSEEEKEMLKEELITNRERGLKVIEAMKARNTQAAAKAPVRPAYARPNAAPPRNPLRNRSGAGGVDPGLAKAIANRAKELQTTARQSGKPISFWKAKSLAEQEIK